MDAYLQTIQEVPLFDGIKTGELPTILQCLQAKTVQYEKDDYILLAGSLPKYVGVILCGRIQVVKDDITGNRTLITSLGTGRYLWRDALLRRGAGEPCLRGRRICLHGFAACIFKNPAHLLERLRISRKTDSKYAFAAGEKESIFTKQPAYPKRQFDQRARTAIP